MATCENMTQEEKAKAYDEAIEKAKIWQEHLYDVNDKDYADELNYIFPELKESEDERIRKEMIFYFTEEIPQCSIQEHSDKMRVFISWLKKQEVERTKLELKAGSSYFCYKSRYERADNETFKKGLIYKCNKDGVLDNFVIKNPEQHFIEIKDERIAWLEKQGEHANFRNKIKIGDKVTRNEDGVLVNLSQLNRVAKKDEKQGEQKPADKVEPKFHEGDIIIHKELGGDYIHNPHKIIQVDILDKKYRLEGGLVAHFGEQDDYELVEQKPAWSEEDEEMLKMVIKLCEQCGNEYAYYWLKSLKDRVQPKQEWSDVDKDILFRTIDSLKFIKDTISTDPEYAVNIIDIEREITWLKSLRPQSQWKPSDLPHWKKSNLPNDNTTGFNSDYFCHKGYCINYKELFEKLPKDD